MDLTEAGFVTKLRTTGRGVTAGWKPLGLALGILAAVLLPALRRRAPPAPAEALRRIAQAQAAFREAAPGRTYAGSLAALGVEGPPGCRVRFLATDQNGASLDPRRRFACCAVPEPPGKGLRTYLVDEAGLVYARDTGGEPPGAWPADDPTEAGWTVLEP